MSNWDFVFPYTEELAQWLLEREYPHPPVRAGNRLPTSGEMRKVIEAEYSYIEPVDEWDCRIFLYRKGSKGFSVSLEGFDWQDDTAIPERYFKIQWCCPLYLRLLIRAGQACGQLAVYPDSGNTAMILDAADDPELVYQRLCEATGRKDEWFYFFNAMYGIPGTDDGTDYH